MKEILSTKNTLIKEFKKLHKKKYREEYQKYILEGFHLIEEAINAGAEIQWLLFNERGKKEWGEWLLEQAPNCCIFVSDEVLVYLSELPAPQGIIAIVNMPMMSVETITAGKWLLLDNIQDPGNVGTMIRTADAAGLSGVILGEGTADIYQTKVLRAMQGSNYHLPIIKHSLMESIETCHKLKIPVYATELNPNALPYTEVNATKQYALVMGNEGQGVSPELLQSANQILYIPMKGKAESLNVAIAAGILMFYL